MKKILLYLPIVLLLALVSCSKEEASKDFESSISKLNSFNETFEKFYEDGIISKEKPEGQDYSEYEKLKKIGSEYYDSINKINNQISKEKESLEKGKKIKGYEESYKQVLKKNETRVNEITTLFQKNIEILNKSKELN